MANKPAELEEWHDCLPPIDSIPSGGRDMLAQLGLRYNSAVVQISLYRPFLHHVASDPGSRDVQGFALGSSCIRASMQAVW